MNRSADRHRFVRVHILTRLFAEKFLHLLLHLRHPGHAADQNHVVDVGCLDTRIRDRSTARRDRFLDQLFDQRLELGARQLDVQMFRTGGIGRDVRQIDVGLLARRQLDLRLLCRVLQALQREHILAEIDALLFLELADDVIDDALIEVFTAEERVAVGRQHFELLFPVHVGDLDDRDVERAAAQVIDGDLTIALVRFVETERERCRSRFVDDALDVEARDAARVLGGLPLESWKYAGTVINASVTARRDILGRFFHLAQHFALTCGGASVCRALDPGVAIRRLTILYDQLEVFCTSFHRSAGRSAVSPHTAVPRMERLRLAAHRPGFAYS